MTKYTARTDDGRTFEIEVYADRVTLTIDGKPLMTLDSRDSDKLATLRVMAERVGWQGIVDANAAAA